MLERLNADLIEVKPGVRIERGPARITEIATEALLSNEVTAAHYTVGQLDALNKPIEIGKTCTLIDWLNPDKVWYVYHEQEFTEKIDGKSLKIKRFITRGDFAGEAEAVAFALSL